MSASLLSLLNQITPLSREEEEAILRAFKPIQLKKGEFFLQAGETARSIGFLQKGLVRYFVMKNDHEGTFEFTGEGEFIGDYQSFNENSVSLQYIQAIEDCEILSTAYPDLQNIFRSLAQGNLLGRIIVEHRFNRMVNQLLSIYLHNPEERYKSFIQNYSALSQRIPQYLIASYIGIKPESLSRIRKRWAKNIS